MSKQHKEQPVMATFSVTYEIYTPESVEAGDARPKQGFICRDVTLREAIYEIGWQAHSHNGDMRWFTNEEYGHYSRDYFKDGREESRSLYVPKSVTDSSRRRIAKLLGVLVR
jgi:hypothetical protein